MTAHLESTHGRGERQGDGKAAARDGDSNSLLVCAAELARLLAVSPATIHRLRSAGKLPRPIPLSRGCVRWRRAAVEAWLAASESAGRLLDQREWDALTRSSKGK